MRRVVVARRAPLLIAAWLILSTGWVLAKTSTDSAAAETVRIALAENPELAAARMAIAEAEARIRAAGRMPNPELSAEIAARNNSEGRVMVGLTQRFPLTGRLRFERNLSVMELEMTRLEVKNRERQLAVEVRNTFYELVAAREHLAMAKRRAEIAKNFAKTLVEGAAQGLTSPLDAQEAELEAQIARLEIDTHQSEVAAALARLNGLLGRPAATPYATPERLNLPKSLPPERPIGQRADLQLAELNVRAGADQVSLARANRWEDIGIGVFVEGERFRDEPEGIEPEALVGVHFSVPLPLWQNGSGKVAEMEAAKARQQKTAEALRSRAKNEAVAARANLVARFRAASQIESILLPSARKQVAETETAYARGEADVQDVYFICAALGAGECRQCRHRSTCRAWRRAGRNH